MVIPDISVACFAALPAFYFHLFPMCAGILHWVICFPWLWSSAGQISDLKFDGFLFLLMACIDLSESVYITLLVSFFLSLSLLSFQGEWMEAFSVSALLFVMFANTAEKSIFPSVLFDPSM